MRTRQLIETLRAANENPLHRRGAYWSVGGDSASYSLPDALPSPVAETRRLAETPTRLSRLDRDVQEKLINWGYAAADTAVRRWYPQGGPYPPPAFPYPAHHL